MCIHATFRTHIIVFTQGHEMSPITCVLQVGHRARWASWSCVTSPGCSWARNSKKKILSSLVRNKAEQPGRGGQLISDSCVLCTLTSFKDRKVPWWNLETSGQWVQQTGWYLKLQLLCLVAWILCSLPSPLYEDLRCHSHGQLYLSCLFKPNWEFYTIPALPINISMWQYG